jgi:CHAT domain-containing protein
MDIDQALQSDWGMAYDERNIGMTYLRMGKLEEAEKSLRSAAERSHSIGDTTNLVKALASLGNALADQGKREAAEESFRQAVDLAGKANIREIVWRGEQGLGRIALAAKDRSTAHGHFKTAIEVVEQMRAAIKIEEFKNGFALNKLDLYEDMILLLLDEGRIDEAFSYSERSRARNFIDLLGNQKVKVARDQDREFLEKQVAMKREITRLEEASLSADTSTKEKAEKDLHDALRRYEDLLIETRLKNPELTAFVSVTPLAVRDVQSLLEPGVALLEYLVAQNEIVCWVITRDKLVVRRTPCPADDLRQKVSTYRKLMQSISDFKEEGRALFDLLIRPILADIEGALYVGIIPHDHLHYLSFASLTDGESYLIERVPLFHVPSASVLKFSFARRQQAKNRTVLGIGNPDLGNDALELPFAEKEVDAIRWSFPNIEILKREAATEKALIDKGSQYGIIHIGSHGEFDPVNPLASRILLAREGETDGSLEVDEIFQLTLQADLVVLSACQSGLGKVEKGDEVIGMNRAFTYAGTHSLLSTLWRVNDVTTAILVKHFYRNYATEDKASSLRKAQLLVKRYYPHPSYWAAFVLTGDYQ